jgi:hypothetical protein
MRLDNLDLLWEGIAAALVMGIVLGGVVGLLIMQTNRLCKRFDKAIRRMK